MPSRDDNYFKGTWWNKLEFPEKQEEGQDGQNIVGTRVKQYESGELAQDQITLDFTTQAKMFDFILMEVIGWNHSGVI